MKLLPERKATFMSDTELNPINANEDEVSFKELATVTVNVGERSIMYEVTLRSPDGGVSLTRYVDHDRPQILSTTHAFPDQEQATLFLLGSIGSLIRGHFGEDRCSQYISEIIDALDVEL